MRLISLAMVAKLFLVTFIFGIATVSSPSIANQSSTKATATVINLSGKQRMLTQKMSKEVLLVALDIDKQKNLENLKKTASLFDKTLMGLRNGSAELKLPKTNNKRVVRQLDKVDGLWKAFYPTVQTIIKTGSVTSEQVAFVADKNLPLLKAMNKAVGQFERAAAKEGFSKDPAMAVTINLSGKQRMLTQKMSKEYLLIAYGHNVEDNKLALLETFSLFDRTLKGLLDGDETLSLPGTKTQDIRDQLNSVSKLWQSFKPLVESGVESTGTLDNGVALKIANQNLPLLKEMNKAVGMYETAAAK